MMRKLLENVVASLHGDLSLAPFDSLSLALDPTKKIVYNGGVYARTMPDDKVYVQAFAIASSDMRLSAIASAERAAAYLVEHAHRASGVKLCQGAWDGAFADEAARVGSLVDESHRSLEFLTRHRVRRVPRRALSGLFAWARGLSIELREDVPRPDEVLALQAKGRRCVSLLPDGVSPEPHESGLDFLIHDLCHLDKFVEPEHHEEQVGFFAALERLFSEPRFHELETKLDRAFVEDRERLAADVNGSAVYLFALLKMKLKMAARRRRARTLGVPARTSGALDDGERAVFDELEGALYDCLGFDAELRDAARATSARRDDTESAARVAGEFRRRGRAVLAELIRESAQPLVASSNPPC